MNEVPDFMRLHHYSIHTERSYCDWIQRFIHFHNMKLQDELTEGALKIEPFLIHLAVDKQVAPSTQNQAMNALVFLRKKIIKQTLDQKIDAVPGKSKKKIPGIMTWEEAYSMPSHQGRCAERRTRSVQGAFPRGAWERGQEETWEREKYVKLKK